MKNVRMGFLAVLALLALSTLPALAINLHNGYVAIKNNGPRPLIIEIQHNFTGSGGARIQPEVEIQPDTTFIANECCYAAGSVYIMYAHFKGYGNIRQMNFIPRLCNVNAIPHGFAAFAIRQHKDEHSGRVYVVDSRVDTSCP